MRRGKLPLNSGLTQVMSSWMKDRVEQQIRPRRQVNFTFAAANTEYRIRHNLPHVPEGYSVVEQDKAGSVYRDATTRKADRFYVYLKSSASALTVVLEVF